jgi:hypothetical protein
MLMPGVVSRWDTGIEIGPGSRVEGTHIAAPIKHISPDGADIYIHAGGSRAQTILYQPDLNTSSKNAIQIADQRLEQDGVNEIESLQTRVLPDDYPGRL